MKKVLFSQKPIFNDQFENNTPQKRTIFNTVIIVFRIYVSPQII